MCLELPVQELLLFFSSWFRFDCLDIRHYLNTITLTFKKNLYKNVIRYVSAATNYFWSIELFVFSFCTEDFSYIIPHPIYMHHLFGFSYYHTHHMWHQSIYLNFLMNLPRSFLYHSFFHLNMTIDAVIFQSSIVLLDTRMQRKSTVVSI